ncbi:hypothetical protein [Methylomonas sp. MgM2]
MNQFNKNLVALAAALAFGANANNAGAATTFSNDVTLNFSIANVTGSGDLSSLEMAGSFMRSGDGFPYVFTETTGDASVNDNNPEIPEAFSSVNIGASFAHGFNLGGSVSDGTIDLNQVAWYDLGITNNGPDTFDITLDFSYDLTAQVQGQNGFAGIDIAYWDWDDESTNYMDSVGASTSTNSTGHSAPGPMQFSFTLGPGGYKGFGVDVAHTAYLEAAPVPLPAAAWPFLSGLIGIAALRKRKPA